MVVERFRKPKGIWARWVKFSSIGVPILGCLYILQVQVYLGLPIYYEQYGGLVLGLVSALAFILKPATRISRQDVIPWYDALFAVISLVIGFYLGIFYPEVGGLYVGYITFHKVVLGAIAIILLLEATRRLVGWPLPILTILFILYGRYTEFLPGPLATAGLSWDRIATSLFLEPGAMLGLPLRIGVTMLLGFLLFGAFLVKCGGLEFITDISSFIMGKYRGGPAKVAVAASGLFGTLSGSAVANAVTIGIVTIPMMKKTGYKSEFAAAVEGVASTGGVIMPPVMGATAFMIAEFLGVSYAKVALSAAIPAVLYYVCLYIQVDLEAAKLGLKGLPGAERPPFLKTIMNGWMIIVPICALVYTLFFWGLTPERAALYSTVPIIVGSFFVKGKGLTLKSFISGLEDATRGMLEVVVICATSGLIIGVVSLTGVGHLFSNILLSLFGGNVLLLLVSAAIVSIILGMGMPGIIIYILQATLIIPALLKFGLDPMASHLFIMYYGIMSFITPPVCLAIYVTAAIAEASINRAGIRACFLAISAYLVPFVFIFDQGLLLQGSLIIILWSTTKALVLCLLLAVTLEGYLFSTLNTAIRVLMGISAALLLLVPLWGEISAVIGLFVAAILFINELRMRQTRLKSVWLETP